MCNLFELMKKDSKQEAQMRKQVRQNKKQTEEQKYSNLIIRIEDSASVEELLRNLDEYTSLTGELPEYIPLLHRIEQKYIVNALSNYKNCKITGNYEILVNLRFNIIDSDHSFLMNNPFHPIRHKMNSIEQFTPDYLAVPLYLYFEDRKLPEAVCVHGVRNGFIIEEDNSYLVDPYLWHYSSKLREELLHEFCEYGTKLFLLLFTNTSYVTNGIIFNEAFLNYLASSRFYYSFIYFFIKNMELLSDEYYFNYFVRRYIIKYTESHQNEETVNKLSNLTPAEMKTLTIIEYDYETIGNDLRKISNGCPLYDREYFVPWSDYIMQFVVNLNKDAMFDAANSNLKYRYSEKGIEEYITKSLNESPIKNISVSELSHYLEYSDSYVQPRIYLHKFLVENK